jgi:hypothetical protein
LSLLHTVCTGTGAHPASYPMDTGTSFPRSRAARAECREKGNVNLYIDSPIRFHVVVLNQLSTGTTLSFTFTITKPLVTGALSSAVERPWREVVHLPPSSRRHSSINPLSVDLHGVVLNQLNTGTNQLPFFYIYFYVIQHDHIHLLQKSDNIYQATRCHIL